MTEKNTGKKKVLTSVFWGKRIAVSLSLAVLIIFSGLYVSRCSRHTSKNPQIHTPPTFEIYPKEEISPRRQIPKPVFVIPKVAIIIDDIGYDLSMAEKFVSLGVPITLSILPHSPFQKTIIRKAGIKKVETMLHLPMEPVEYPSVHPGPGALLTWMSPEKLLSQLNRNLDAMPFIRGVNNHMGSKMTTVPTHMYRVLSVLKQRSLFFIDSLTSADSCGWSSARLLQIPFAQRDVFLDHVQDPEIVREQIRRLIRIANHFGEAVGIGHPHAVTYDAIREMLPQLRKKVRLVPASQLVHTTG